MAKKPEPVWYQPVSPPALPQTREQMVNLFRDAGAALAGILFDLHTKQSDAPEPPPALSDHMNRREVAEYLRISVSLLDILRRTTDFPQMHITNRKVVISRAAVDEWTKYNRPRINKPRADGAKPKVARRRSRRVDAMPPD